MTAVVSFMIEQLDRRHAVFCEMLNKPGTCDSLFKTFTNAGLSHMKRKKITFSMTEHALLLFNRKGSLEIE
jgi:hypothetical protein